MSYIFVHIIIFGAALVGSFVAGLSYDALVGPARTEVTTDDQLHRAILSLGADMFKHDLHLDSSLAMYLVSVDGRTTDMLVIPPNHGDGLTKGTSQAGNVTATYHMFPNGTRTYLAVGQDGTVLKDIVIHDDPRYTFRMFMVNESE